MDRGLLEEDQLLARRLGLALALAAALAEVEVEVGLGLRDEVTDDLALLVEVLAVDGALELELVLAAGVEPCALSATL